MFHFITTKVVDSKRDSKLDLGCYGGQYESRLFGKKKKWALYISLIHITGPDSNSVNIRGMSSCFSVACCKPSLDDSGNIFFVLFSFDAMKSSGSNRNALQWLMFRPFLYPRVCTDVRVFRQDRDVLSTVSRSIEGFFNPTTSCDAVRYWLIHSAGILKVFSLVPIRAVFVMSHSQNGSFHWSAEKYFKSHEKTNV